MPGANAEGARGSRLQVPVLCTWAPLRRAVARQGSCLHAVFLSRANCATRQPGLSRKRRASLLPDR
eukprot:1442194-Rhodomonas_salina.1